MAPILTPLRLRVALAALALLGGLAAWDAWRLHQARDWNAKFGDGSIAQATEALPPEARFAQAFHLGRGGDIQRSLALYQEIAAGGNGSLGSAARYNIGNLFLREALRAIREDKRAEALPYVELAKQSYREALRADPGRWDARYNLEQALRLIPEQESADAGDGPGPLQSERAITTMKGFTLGLP
jgi:mxaK protein